LQLLLWKIFDSPFLVKISLYPYEKLSEIKILNKLSEILHYIKDKCDPLTIEMTDDPFVALRGVMEDSSGLINIHEGSH
jgi:hypothetical protein